MYMVAKTSIRAALEICGDSMSTTYSVELLISIKRRVSRLKEKSGNKSLWQESLLLRSHITRVWFRRQIKSSLYMEVW